MGSCEVLGIVDRSINYFDPGVVLTLIGGRHHMYDG